MESPWEKRLQLFAKIKCGLVKKVRASKLFYRYCLRNQQTNSFTWEGSSLYSQLISDVSVSVRGWVCRERKGFHLQFVHLEPFFPLHRHRLFHFGEKIINWMGINAKARRFILAFPGFSERERKKGNLRYDLMLPCDTGIPGKFPVYFLPGSVLNFFCGWRLALGGMLRSVRRTSPVA